MVLPEELQEELIGDAQELEQGTFEWHMSRLKCCTMSRAKDVRNQTTYESFWNLKAKTIEKGLQATWSKILTFVEKNKSGYLSLLVVE